ncbi:hypothetical protein ACCD00_10130 [Pseudomonas sp. Pseusp3]|uniref:hypothetical protein n=1 Tax=Pseudomonas sp. Pseusp3 TaxID=3243029 RepID=UPI0039B0E16D
MSKARKTLIDKTDFQDEQYNGWSFAQGNKVLESEGSNFFITNLLFPAQQNLQITKQYDQDFAGTYEITFKLFISSDIKNPSLNVWLFGQNEIPNEKVTTGKWIACKKTLKAEKPDLNKLHILVNGTYPDGVGRAKFDNITIYKL